MRAEFAQGDIVKFDGGDHPAGESDLGVIINADCDIQNNKLGGHISYLPIYHVSEYLNAFWAPKQISAILTDTIAHLSKLCEFKPQEASDLRQWLAEDDVKHVTERLVTRLDLKKAAEENVRKLFLKSSICLCGDEPIRKLTRLSTLESNPRAYLMKQLTAGRKAIQEGGLFVSEILGERRLGFVIRLSRVLSIRAERCFRSESDRLSRGGDGRAGVRVAQLTPPYKYRVAQLFAYQFSRIGLPDELLALESIALDELADGLISELSN